MNKPNYAKISSDNIKLLLVSKNLSIRNIAEELKIPPSTLNDSLKSKKGVSINHLIKIADYFEITVNDLCNPNFLELYSKDKENTALIMNKYSMLDEHGRKIISTIIDIELDRILNSYT